MDETSMNREVFFFFFSTNLGRRVRQLGHVRQKGRMRVRNRVCFESDRGNRATRRKPVELRGEEHTTNSNHMRQTPTVHNGYQTCVLSGDKRVPHHCATPRPQLK